jgi:hypothetical protein
MEQQKDKRDQEHEGNIKTKTDITTCFLSHSMIPSYPPEYNIFPRFYFAKEHVFVLQPGNALYIPPGWCHWVFSYPNLEEDNGPDARHSSANIALSFPVTKFAGNILPPFKDEKPLAFTLINLPFLQWDFNKLFNNDNQEDDVVDVNNVHDVIYSKGSTLNVVRKPNGNICHTRKVSKEKFVKMVSEGKYNISLGQNDTILSGSNLHQESRPPDFWLGSLWGSKIRSNLWVTSCLNQSGVDTGLHYDATYNLLVQIKGVKIVRLYAPEDQQNLYITSLAN